MRERSDNALIFVFTLTILIALFVLTYNHPEQLPLQPLATLTVGIIGAYVATTQIQANRQAAINKNTLDFMFKFDADKYYVELRTKWASEYENNQKEASAYDALLANLKRGEPCKKTTNYMEICDFMTLMDVIAQSVKANVFDEALIVSTYDLQLMIYWNGMQPYLKSYRQYRDPTHLKDFEELVAKCKKHHGADLKLV